MSSKQAAKFIKCSLCDDKPATIRCLTCSTKENKSRKYCYNCEKQHHDPETMRNHKKELIPYSEMCGVNDSNRENMYNFNKTQGISFYETGILDGKITNSHLKNSENNVSNDLILDKLQESINEYRNTKDNRSSEMKYRIKLQEQENLIIFLKNQAENLENRYIENLNKMRKELLETQETFERQKMGLNQQYEDKLRNLEERNRILERNYEGELSKNKGLVKELDEIHKIKTAIEREYEENVKLLKENYETKSKVHENSLENLNNKLEEFKKRSYQEHEQNMNNVRKEAENAINSMKKEVDEKMSKIKGLEQEVMKEKLEVSHKESQLNFLLKSKEEENDKMKKLMDKQKDEIVRSDRLAQEIRQEVYILQRELELSEKEKERLKKEKEKAERKIDKYEKIIYGGKKGETIKK